MEGLNDDYVYNLGYEEFIKQGKRNMTKVIDYFTYAAIRGNVAALNALGFLYLEGVFDEDTQSYILQRNVSEALYLFQMAVDEGNMESAINLGKLYFNGIKDEQDGGVLLEANSSNALDHFSMAIQEDFALGYHVMGEMVHFFESNMS